jgi:hypothetical protein
MSDVQYKFVDGRAVVNDWGWLNTHTYKELVELLNLLNARRGS